MSNEVALRSQGASDRKALVDAAFRAEYVTVGWMVIEAVVAITAAVEANSLALLAFGIDSIIELLSAGVLIWRLTVEIRRGQHFAERAEQRAARIAGILLFALAAYVVIAAAWKLGTQQGAEFSALGLAITMLAIPIMYFLARRKLKLAQALGSRALRADAVESITCGWLSVVVVFALLVQLLTRAWWVDPVASLAVVWFLVREGREAFSGNECSDHCN